jgi:hypothetical protein
VVVRFAELVDPMFFEAFESRDAGLDGGAFLVVQPGELVLSIRLTLDLGAG